MQLSDSAVGLVRALAETFPAEFAIRWEGSELAVSSDHPLVDELQALGASATCSLPYFRNDELRWMTLGGTKEEMRGAVESLRAWLMPQYAQEGRLAFVSGREAAGPLAPCIVALSPHGYYRWRCSRSDARATINKLRQMRAVNRRRPSPRESVVRSLLDLRMRFQAALVTADWVAAGRAIDEIDSYQLDSALNTSQMRVRLWSSTSDHRRVRELADTSNLLHLRLTPRVREAILEAYATLELGELEEAGQFLDAAELYRKKLHAQLSEAISMESASDRLPICRLIAYRAWADSDRETLWEASLSGQDGVIQALRADLPLTPATQTAAERVGEVLPAEAGARFGELTKLLRSGSGALLDDFLESNCTIDNLRDAGKAESYAETLLEAFTDTALMNDAAGIRLCRQALLKVIDTVLCDATFPQPEFTGLYRDILELWILDRASSSFPPDGQLVLAVGAGLLQMSSKHESAVTQVIERWWNQRPIRARLPWLLAALDLLSIQTAKPVGYQALWLSGADIIRRDPSCVTPGELELWRQVGRRLEVEEASVAQYLGEIAKESSARDILADIGLRQIAIVTLHERAGKMACDVLRERTGASVYLVTSIVADASTRAAAEADLILFVWAATKHAVLRAFDGVRKKIEYVQGTGPTSIVLAAERWAALNAKT